MQIRLLLILALVALAFYLFRRNLPQLTRSPLGRLLMSGAVFYLIRNTLARHGLPVLMSLLRSLRFFR